MSSSREDTKHLPPKKRWLVSLQNYNQNVTYPTLSSSKSESSETRGDEQLQSKLARILTFTWPTSPRSPRHSILTKIGWIQEHFLFEQRLDADDIANNRIKIPWKTAEKHFPPHTPNYFSESAIITDVQRNNWPVSVLNDPRTGVYVIATGWRGIAAVHNMEARDLVKFHRPLKPSRLYHYLIKLEKKPEKKTVALNVKTDGFELDFLFYKKLTANEITMRHLSIPTRQAEKHFPTLRNPDGSYKETGILVSDAQNRKWPMKLKFSILSDAYMIGSGWREFVAEHNLKARDLIRFFKVVKNDPNDKHYFVDYLRRSEEAGKGGGSRSKKHGGGGSKKHGGDERRPPPTGSCRI
ncbi:hypothetical protein U1Q18_033792 [Sarracenia purpurea var. burkii]